jgi:hypothetical protein
LNLHLNLMGHMHFCQFIKTAWFINAAECQF